MKNITRNIFILRFIVSVLLTGVLVFPVWYWISPDTLDATGHSIGLVQAYGGYDKLTLIQKVGGFVATFIPAVLVAGALFFLLKIINRLSKGRWFEEKNERDWAKIGYLLLGHVIAEILYRPLLVLVLTMNNPAGERVLHISLFSNDIKALVPALLALVISYMVSIARRQRDELNEIV